MPTDSLPPEVHRVLSRLADGTRIYYFYLRGRRGSRFYKSAARLPRDRDFYEAYSAALEAAAPKSSGYTTERLVDDYLSSPDYVKLAQRTKADYRKWLDRFAAEFGVDPVAMFSEWESLELIEDWRDQWKTSPKQFDYAGTVVTILLNWAQRRGRLERHHCNFKKMYKANRAHIVWTGDHVEKFLAVAPENIQRVLIAALETGLRPGDLVQLRRFDVETTEGGNRRLRVRTNKRGRFAHIPVTPAMAEIIDSAPPGQEYILTNPSGKPWTERYVSQRLSFWKNKAGLTEEALGYSLHMHDCRGTATTKLLQVGADANELASVFGWDLRYATQMIETYAVIGTDQTDKILDLVARAEKNAK